MVNTACGGPADQVFTVTPAIPFQLSWGVIPGDPATDVVAGLRLQLNGCGAEGGSCINAFGAGQAENGIGLGTQPAGTLVVLVAEGNTGPYTLWVEVAPQ